MLDRKILFSLAEGKDIVADDFNTDEDVDPQFKCPRCGSSWFGSSSIGSVVQKYHCHDEYNNGCSWSGSFSECFIATYSLSILAGELLRVYDRLEELEDK